MKIVEWLHAHPKFEGVYVFFTTFFTVCFFILHF